ncbi:hypothetical protein KR50_20430 [Jeotgalibacillus campisalis]|uniref:Uncharacterized protein n=1 Tax=Jeotgalibacillus campisalis TaxID=220754 RepID=A0A0C2VTX6_9BACL|nr:hypothetical protein KR50_20430 [Jeotgalibacillus campisalis]
MSLLIGVIIVILSACLLYWQLKREHEKRNVFLLFILFALSLIGLWLIFDWIVLYLWSS